jgi:hypothetical protein
MGLKGYRLWVMGQLDSTCRAPPHLLSRPAVAPGQVGQRRGVALQVVYLKGKL